MGTAAVLPNPSRATLAKWIDETWDAFPNHIVENSWRKTNYDWFETEPREESEEEHMYACLLEQDDDTSGDSLLTDRGYLKKDLI